MQKGSKLKSKKPEVDGVADEEQASHSALLSEKEAEDQDEAMSCSLSEKDFKIYDE